MFIEQTNKMQQQRMLYLLCRRQTEINFFITAVSRSVVIAVNIYPNTCRAQAYKKITTKTTTDKFIKIYISSVSTIS